jgi:hypothetical protein
MVYVQHIHEQSKVVVAGPQEIVLLFIKYLIHDLRICAWCTVSIWKIGPIKEQIFDVVKDYFHLAQFFVQLTKD